MTETVWVAVVTGVFTLGASVLATYLAQSGASKTAALGLTETRRREVRALLVELSDAGQRWVSSQEIFVPALYKSAMEYMKFLTEFSDTDSGKQIGQNNATIRRAGGELLLMVKDEVLLSAVNDVLVLHEGFGNEVTQKLVDTAKAHNGEGDFEVALEGLHYVRLLEGCLDRVKKRGAELLRGDL